MKIFDKDNSLDIRIARYEFPNASSDLYALNWLVIQLFVSDAKGSWVTESSCLLTSEVRHLADWFDQINDGDLRTKEISFLEPTIAFSIKDSAQEGILRVHLSTEVFPVWAVGQDEYLIDFRMSEVDFQAASESLRKQLEKYPQRAIK
jgi:hypothetical protein